MPQLPCTGQPKEWEFGREQAIIESKNIATAYSKATGSGPDVAKGILDKYNVENRFLIGDTGIMGADMPEDQFEALKADLEAEDFEVQVEHTMRPFN